MEPNLGTIPDGLQAPERRALLDRPRLFALLSELPALTVVRGPRGAGKTCLLTTWTASPQAPRGPVVALATPTGSTDTEGYWFEVSRRVDAARAGADEAVTLVLDDVDRLDDPTTEARILGLLDGPGGLHVVVTTRSTRVFGDAALLDTEHVTISPRELLFTADESRAALLARGIELPRHLLDTVHDVTGGFPPLVQVAADAARPFDTDLDHGPESARCAVERAVDRYIERTIREEPELAGLRAFAMTIAAARTVTVPAAEVLAGADAAEHVRELESAGVLVRSPWPNDDEWHFPPPIRASLMRAVRGEAPDGPLRASSTLANWFRGRGDSAAAIEHAIEAQDWDLTADILETNWLELISRRFRLVRDALLALPADVADTNPSIRSGRELFLRFGSDATYFTEPPSFEMSTARSSDPAASVDALSVGSVQSLTLRVSGHFAQAAEMSVRLSVLGDRVMTMGKPEVAGLLPLMRLQWGITHQLHGDLGRASAEFRRAYNGNGPAGTDFITRNAAGGLALNYALAGELGHAEAWLAKERQFDDESAWVTEKIRTGGLVASALVAMDRMELDVAEKVLAELGDLPDDEELWAFAVYAHCQLALVTRQAEMGIDRVRRATAVYERWLTPGSIAAPLLAAAEADLQLALGRGNESWTTLANAHGRGPWATVAHARLELSSGEPAETLAVCARPSVADCPFPRIRMESALVQAAAHLDLGNADQAHALLRRAVALFDQTGLVRPFASMPTERTARLSELDVALPTAWTSAVPAPGAAVYPDRVRLVHLSERESAVLSALQSTPSIATIATQLFVSQNTVKTQLRSLYRKLGVHSRADALLTAARLGLIGPGAKT